MDATVSPELSDFTSALIHSRQNVSPRRLDAPGPTPAQLQAILGAAAAAPDHGQLTPWRFVIVPHARRWLLADAFGLALIDRDPNATGEQIDNAREKAHRAPFLMLAVARLNDPHAAADAPPRSHGSAEVEVGDAERLVSLGCAIQNILLTAHALGLGTGLTSGQAMASPRLRTLFGLRPGEQAICCINIGSVTRRKPPRVRPQTANYISSL
jgi:nitroreductase